MKGNNREPNGDSGYVNFILRNHYPGSKELNKQDWRDIMHFVLHTISFRDKDFDGSGTISPGGGVMKREFFAASHDFPCAESSTEYPVRLTIKKAVKKLDFSVDASSKLIPLCPIDTKRQFNYYEFNRGKANDQFLFKLLDTFYGWVILTRTIREIKHTNLQGRRIYSSYYEIAHCYRAIPREDLEDMIFVKPKLGLMIIQSYIKYFEQELDKKMEPINFVRSQLSYVQGVRNRLLIT